MDHRKSLAWAALLLTGCSLFRWSGYPDGRAPGSWSAVELAVSTAPARSRALPPPFIPLRDVPATLYYSDLGPEEIDVSGYPAQQQYNYAIFRLQCGRCHTLARAVNSPTQSRVYWHFHLARMSLHSRLRRSGPIPADELKAVLDFLDYDAKTRKIGDRRRFDEQTEELKRRFEPTLRRLLEQTRRER